MKWNKKNDTFTLSREELADVLTFLEYIDKFVKTKPIGWRKFRKTVFKGMNKILFDSAKKKFKTKR